MAVQQVTTFQEVLDIVESLPEYQQETLIDIIQKRLIEHKRELLAGSIKEARGEYGRGEIRGGTVDDLMRELRNGDTNGCVEFHGAMICKRDNAIQQERK